MRYTRFHSIKVGCVDVNRHCFRLSLSASFSTSHRAIAASSPLKTLAAAEEPNAEVVQQPTSQHSQHGSAHQQVLHRPLDQPAQQPRDDDQVVSDIERELEQEHQRQQQLVVSAAMQAMGALPPNAVFKVPAAPLDMVNAIRNCNGTCSQRKQKTLDSDEAAVQEEWDAIPHETSAPSSGASALPAQASAAAQLAAAISYDEALAALAAADMSAAVPSVVLYEPPTSCFGRLLHCFGRPSLHIENAANELQLPFLLALTPYDRYPSFVMLIYCCMLSTAFNDTVQVERHACVHHHHVLLQNYR
jgi:hypothetical protein